MLARMAKHIGAVAADAISHRSAQIVVDGVTIAFPLENAIDMDAELPRLSKVAAAVQKDCDSLAARLANLAFTSWAKPEAVEKAHADHDARAAEAAWL